MTEKLYYRDAYIKEFSARVLMCGKTDGGFDTVLDKTAFFPEEGGQSADTGEISGVRVLDVREEDGVIHHITDGELKVGREVLGKIDFNVRFEKMQCHTAEHILCGIIHKLYGYENVGFHLSDCEVVFDIDGVLTYEELTRVREIANRAVYENKEVTAYFPDASELSSLTYRAKLELTENVRIVNIDGYDSCACCAPHVSRTGEIGTIAITGVEKHRGGTRIFMLAGKRAERDYAERCRVARRISALTSEPQATIDTAVEKLVKECENLRQNLKSARLREAELRAQIMEKIDKNAVVLLSDFNIPELIAFSNSALSKVGGILVLLSGTDGNFKYVISSRTVDLRVLAKDINSALSGRGGGKPEMLQGSFASSLSEIKSYFEK